MKRIVVVLMSIGMLAVSLGSAEAGKSKRVERTVQGSYAAYPTPVTGCNEALGPWACLIVQTRLSEAFFTATVADAHGQPVAVDVYNRGRVIASFCGKTDRPIAVTPGSSLEFDIGFGRGAVAPCPTHRVKTVGKIAVTLSNLR